MASCTCGTRARPRRLGTWTRLAGDETDSTARSISHRPSAIWPACTATRARRIDRHAARARNGILRIERTLLIGPVLVMPQDVPNLRSRSIDIGAPTGMHAGRRAREGTGGGGSGGDQRPGRRLSQWLSLGAGDERCGWRHLRRMPFRSGRAVYLITGGTGGLGLALARHLARTLKARLVLTARSAIPERPSGPISSRTRRRQQT